MAVNPLNVALVVTGGLVLVLGLFSNPLSRGPLTAPIIALLVGVGLGPSGAGVASVAAWGDQTAILEQVARLTLTVGLMGVALRLPLDAIRRQRRALATMLGLVMPLMWLSGALLAYLILGLPLWSALLIGAILSPTDPVVASTITSGALAKEALPDRIRQLLSAESGLNDGLAYPFVFLPLLLLTRPPGEAVSRWLLHTLAWDVVGATVAGALLGYGAGWLLARSDRRGGIERTSRLAYALALSLTALSLTRLIGSNGILAVPIAGLAYKIASGAAQRDEQEDVQETINHFFVLPAFVLLGLALPWQGWLALGWRGPLLAGAVLLVRRLPALLLVRRALGAGWTVRDAAFMGWFGPIGIGALYYATAAQRLTGTNEAWTISSLIIFSSVLVHGLTAAPLTRRYGRQTKATP